MRSVRSAYDRGSSATLVGNRMGDQNFNISSSSVVSEGALSRWSRLYLQALAPTNPHCARVVGYGPFSLWVCQKEGLCPSSGDINRLMMMIKIRRTALEST
jgi:hypothetical protein